MSVVGLIEVVRQLGKSETIKGILDYIFGRKRKRIKKELDEIHAKAKKTGNMDAINKRKSSAK